MALAESYEVYRRSAGGGETLCGSSQGTLFSDEAAAPGTAYLYRVRAVNGTGKSIFSAPDLATTVVFTDSPLFRAVVRSDHLAQLRAAVIAVSALAGLPLPDFTDQAEAGTPVRAVHVTELNAAIFAARTALWDFVPKRSSVHSPGTASFMIISSGFARRFGSPETRSTAPNERRLAVPGNAPLG